MRMCVVLICTEQFNPPGLDERTYFAKRSLPQNFEQFKLRGVGLLRALLDDVGDVDLLDVSIFLRRSKQMKA